MDQLDRYGPDDERDSTVGAHEHRILSLVPAPPQTRAAYLDSQEPEGYFLVPVVAWALWACSDCGSQWTSAMIQAPNGSGNALARVDLWGGFWLVLGPEEASPSREEAWAELRRRETEGRREAAADELEELFTLPAISEAERAANKRPEPDPIGQRAYDAVKLAMSWPSWRPEYDFGVAAEAALAKARRSPTASLKALAQTARYAAEQAAQTP